MLHVVDDRRQEALEGYVEDLGPEGCAGLESIAMDMWALFVAATRAYVPEANGNIVFDKCRIARHLGDAVDRVRRQENQDLGLARFTDEYAACEEN